MCGVDLEHGPPRSIEAVCHQANVPNEIEASRQNPFANFVANERSIVLIDTIGMPQRLPVPNSLCPYQVTSRQQMNDVVRKAFEPHMNLVPQHHATALGFE